MTEEIKLAIIFKNIKRNFKTHFKSASIGWFMIFVYLCMIFFILGLFLGVPTAELATKKGIIATANAFLPFLILNFFSITHPLISDIRYYFFTFACGLSCYWAYYEIKRKNESDF